VTSFSELKIPSAVDIKPNIKQELLNGALQVKNILTGEMNETIKVESHKNN